ncbi:cell wall-binding repeat-containing protein [Alteribacter lacisalsi]|uniref:cell wall-binding repeat-containing protein n=1 Tax=Alteribacter lacisalsi TaxID=2045244 RepID=UPI0038B27131
MSSVVLETDAEFADGSRISGENRYETAVEVSKAGWNIADTIVIASGTDFPDALAGAPLAYELDAPILLAGSGDELPAVTAAEADRLGAEHAVILGGNAAVSEGVEAQLESLGLTVERIAGENRYDTAARISDRLENRGDKTFLVRANDYPDALTAASFAAQNGYPILLSGSYSIDNQTWRALGGGSEVFVIGGESVISEDVVERIDRVSRYTATRIAGENRYDTSREVIDHFNPRMQEVYVSSGVNFPDALTGSVLAAKEGKPVVLAGSTRVNEATEAIFTENNVRGFNVIGGPAAVSDDVVNTLLQAIE